MLFRSFKDTSVEKDYRLPMTRGEFQPKTWYSDDFLIKAEKRAIQADPSKAKQKELNSEAEKLEAIFGNASRAANDTFNKNLNESLGLQMQIKEARKAGNTELVKQLSEQLKIKRQETAQADKQKDQLEGLRKAALPPVPNGQPPPPPEPLCVLP